MKAMCGASARARPDPAETASSPTSPACSSAISPMYRPAIIPCRATATARPLALLARSRAYFADLPLAAERKAERRGDEVRSA